MDGVFVQVSKLCWVMEVKQFVEEVDVVVGLVVGVFVLVELEEEVVGVFGDWDEEGEVGVEFEKVKVFVGCEWVVEYWVV